MLGEVDASHACRELTSAYRRQSLMRAHQGRSWLKGKGASFGPLGVDRNTRMKWALETKNRANDLYRDGRLEEAQQLYVDCLSAIDDSLEMKGKVLRSSR